MSAGQAEQWGRIAECLKKARMEHRAILDTHPNAFNRGMFFGLCSAQQQALMFRHSALRTGELIPEHLIQDRPDNQLLQDYCAFLINAVKVKTDISITKEAGKNHPMENETVAFHYGWIVGLESVQSSGKL
jgi:hypothetical protein